MKEWASKHNKLGNVKLPVPLGLSILAGSQSLFAHTSSDSLSLILIKPIGYFLLGHQLGGPGKLVLDVGQNLWDTEQLFCVFV